MRAAVAAGHRSIVLCGDDVGSYGQDLGSDIAALLERLTSSDDGLRLILRNVEPQWIIRYWSRLAPILASGTVTYLVVPLQSGCDRTLVRMNREYTCREFQAMAEGIRRVAPRTVVRTHVIVGFPGETDRDFEETCRFLGDVPLDHFYPHRFSERPGTAASAMPDPVPRHTIEARWRRLRRMNYTALARWHRWLPWCR